MSFSHFLYTDQWFEIICVDLFYDASNHVIASLLGQINVIMGDLNLINNEHVSMLSTM